MITGYAHRVRNRSRKKGAQEYIPNPFLRGNCALLSNGPSRETLIEENLPETELGQANVRNVVVGKSQVMEQLFGLIKGGLTDSVLITGESGSGKEIGSSHPFRGARADAVCYGELLGDPRIS